MTVLVFAATWVFRWLTIDFTNDHFVHLSRARQILLGEIPVRDFFDPGLPLHYYASAAALMAFGQNLLGEAILTVTLVALGAALTFYLAVRTSRSVLLALIATIVAVVLFPRLYNYPKIFLYPLALVAIAHYAARRNTTAIVVLGMITAVAALFRLDHGLYVGIAVTVGLFLTDVDQLRNAATAFLRYAAVVGVLLLPFVVFVQVTTGVPSFLTEIRQQRAAVAGARILSIPFSIDRALPMVVVDPPSTSNTSWLLRARNRWPLLRTRVAPGVLSAANALAWLYYVTVLMPVAALVMLVVQWRRGRPGPAERVTIGAAIVICLVIHQALLRESPDSRLPDVAGPTVVLAAWLTGSLLQTVQRRARIILRVAVTVVWMATLWSATTFGEFGERLTATGLPAGPSATAERFHQVSIWMQMRPIDLYAPSGDSTGIRALTRYVLECTRPSDRILAGSFEPQLFFYAERAFAGGQVYLKGGWHDSEDAQKLTIERLQRQRVPIVIINAATEAEVQSRFSLVYQYVQKNYREASRANFGSGPDYAVFVKRDLAPRGQDTALGLPCYR